MDRHKSSKSLVLSEKELRLIEGWYNAADGESYTALASCFATNKDKQMHLALLEKLGFKLASGDQYILDSSRAVTV